MTMLAVTYDMCKNLAPIIILVKNVFTIIMIAIPIAFLIFGTIDLGKAVMAGKEDDMKKAQSTLIKRGIYTVVIFLMIPILNLVLSLLSGSTTEDTGSWYTCYQCSDSTCSNYNKIVK